uniref:Uncharacterized protein n=1 Tax=Aegilops tauschii TaxID=37682 RepID=R7WD20_AEGTA
MEAFASARPAEAPAPPPPPPPRACCYIRRGVEAAAPVRLGVRRAHVRLRTPPSASQREVHGPGAIRSRPRRSGRPMQRRSTGPSWGRNAHGYKGKRPRPVSSSALGNWMASPKTPTQSTGAQEEAAARQSLIAARQSLIGISQSTPAAGEALSVKSPNGRMEHGQDDSGAADKSRSMLMSISNQSPEARQATPCPHSNAA